MMTLAQFQAMVPLGNAIDLYHLLDRALAERGATRAVENQFRVYTIAFTRNVVVNLYDKLLGLIPYFLIDPAEINLNSVVNGRVRCYNIATLTQSRTNGFLTPVSMSWENPAPLVERYDNWPFGIGDTVEVRYPRPHHLYRLCGEYFLQAAEMIQHLRYFAISTRRMSIRIPVFAGSNTRSHIYAIRQNSSGEPLRLTKIWSSYLAPGKYYLDDFGDYRTDEYPAAQLVGYIDLKDNLQFFTP